MAARLDNSENWVIVCLAIGKDNPNDLLIEPGLIVPMIWEPLEDKTWELYLT